MENSYLPCSQAAFAALAGEVLHQGKAVRFRAHGISMRPLLRDGDLLTVEPLPGGRIRIGEVVLCRTAGGRIVVHRVVGLQRQESQTVYLVQGDQVSTPDGLIPPDQIFGRVVRVERDGIMLSTGSPAMRMLGLLAVLRSRTGSGPGWWRIPVRFARRLPVLCKYLV